MTEEQQGRPTALAVTGLRVEYPGGRRRGPVRVIDDVGFRIATGETLALVGESGSGKSTIGKAILGLVPAAAGRIELGGRDITAIPVRRRAAFARELQVVFQDPYGSLNPSLRIGDILSEPLEAGGGMPRAEARRVVRDLLSRVGLPADAADRYPGSFSGGQRQRIAIARAVSVDPAVIICDEPTSALDVSTQVQVLELLRELQQNLGVAYLFITHDLALVRGFADRVAVLRGGRIVEEGAAAAVCDAPRDLYTQALMGATPVPDPVRQRERRVARRELLTRLRESEKEAS
ncbi:ATP-binding cassette domain-containing protein [Microbacterium sp.]|uniref:ABC transporter ATP-binding protein n=1 Tax=Microbacterium sp. TaxID=51671 RepID=UPI003342D60C